MANPTLSQIKVGQTTYDICDATARDSISQINNLLTTELIEDNLSAVLKSQGSNMTISFIRFNRWGKVAMLYLRGVTSVARTAGSMFDFCTVTENIWPVAEAGCTTGDTADISFITATGLIRYKAANAKPANLALYVKCSYILA